MSTRAIIALPTAKGYRTAWVWNDAFPNQLGKMLKTKFNTEKLVRELLNNVNFGSMMTKDMKADFENCLRIVFQKIRDSKNFQMECTSVT